MVVGHQVELDRHLGLLMLDWCTNKDLSRIACFIEPALLGQSSALLSRFQAEPGVCDGGLQGSLGLGCRVQEGYVEGTVHGSDVVLGCEGLQREKSRVTVQWEHSRPRCQTVE